MLPLAVGAFVLLKKARCFNSSQFENRQTVPQWICAAQQPEFTKVVSLLPRSGVATIRTNYWFPLIDPTCNATVDVTELDIKEDVIFPRLACINYAPAMKMMPTLQELFTGSAKSTTPFYRSMPPKSGVIVFIRDEEELVTRECEQELSTISRSAAEADVFVTFAILIP